MQISVRDVRIAKLKEGKLPPPHRARLEAVLNKQRPIRNILNPTLPTAVRTCYRIQFVGLQGKEHTKDTAHGCTVVRLHGRAHEARVRTQMSLKNACEQI